MPAFSPDPDNTVSWGRKLNYWRRITLLLMKKKKKKKREHVAHVPGRRVIVWTTFFNFSSCQNLCQNIWRFLISCKILFFFFNVLFFTFSNAVSNYALGIGHVIVVSSSSRPKGENLNRLFFFSRGRTKSLIKVWATRFSMNIFLHLWKFVSH